ncbi:PIR protein [Plasmodium ovale]|uniref:PIR protein n=1 Tax=Plasmodium ovale TaxID=36330 RepID=A0A1D3JD00_PLAOA|nr:PIR protein [Plasmodium ovale]
MNIPECEYFDELSVTKIYEEFREVCEVKSNNQKCFTETLDDPHYCSSVADKLNELKSKLNGKLQTYQGAYNGTFSDENVEDIKKQCICLKQSFYSKVIKDVKNPTNVYKSVKTCNSVIQNKTIDVPSNLCTFRNLNFRDIKRIKRIYDFYLFYYRNIKDLAVDQKLNKKPEGFRKGFYELCSSIIECLNNTSNSEYCEEFREYNNKYNAFEVFLKSLKSHPEKIDGSDCSYGCVLSQRLFSGHYLLKLREEIQKIRSGYRSTNSQTTAITIVSLVIGTVITPSVICLRIRKKMNKETHAKVDNETESNSLFTSENLENNSKSKGYSILYKSTKYS